MTVHVWSKNLGNVQAVVTNLAPDVRVVTPHVFARLVRNNIGRRLAYDFASSLQGWAGGTGGRTYDKAQWTATGGNPGGRLLLDGSDFGQADTTPNSWFSRQVILPPNATTLSFDTLASNDGRLRVRLQRSDGAYVTLLDWESLQTHNTWVNRSADLAAYAGQTVTLLFEQNDGGQGSGEYRYVDNVAVTTAGPSCYVPDAPRILDLTAANSVSLFWRDNDTAGTGLKVERRLEPGGGWGEIASLPVGVTNFTDSQVIAGTNYSYRVRSWNAAGFSLHSNVRSVTTLPRPVLSVAAGVNSFQLAWPIWAATFDPYSATNFELAAVWSPVTNPVSNTGSNFSATVPSGPVARFFRLKGR